MAGGKGGEGVLSSTRSDADPQVKSRQSRTRRAGLMRHAQIANDGNEEARGAHTGAWLDFMVRHGQQQSS